MTMSPTIRAAVFVGPNEVKLEQRPRPRLSSPSDVLIAVEACGICGTDLHILEEPPGHPATRGVVLGHEIVGRVVEAGPEALGASPGERVVVAPNLYCGSCSACRRGIFSSCDHFSTVGIFRDGGLADLVSVPCHACHPITEALSAPVAALTEPLSCVMNGVRQAKPVPGEVALIYGAGPIGLLFLAALRAGGARCVVVEPFALRRKMAKKMGAYAVLKPEELELDDSRALIEVAPDGADLTIDAVGSQFCSALAHTRPQGRVLLFGMNSTARAEVAQNYITRKELKILGTYVGEFTFPPAVRLQESGLVDLGPAVSHVVPLERVADAFDALRSGEAVKVIVSVTSQEVVK